MNSRDTIEAALRGAAGWGDSDRVDRLLDGHREEVLAEVTAWLIKKSREYPRRNQLGRTQSDTAAALASKVARGAVRPDNLRMLPPDFFQPGHTYTEPDGSTDWRFRCDSVTDHPDDGERTALGWRHFRGEWEPYAYGEDDWEIHQHVGYTDVTGEVTA